MTATSQHSYTATLDLPQTAASNIGFDDGHPFAEAGADEGVIVQEGSRFVAVTKGEETGPSWNVTIQNGVVSADDGALSVTGGSVTLDASAIPHVSASVTLAVEDAALLDDLDPRDSRRVKVKARGTFPASFGWRFIERDFDLGIRSASPNRAEGTVTLTLASDEALLQDFAQMMDDRAPRALESSLRAVCDYVLGKIGAALEPGGPDADVTAYWDVTNLVPNPVPTSAVGYIAGPGTSAVGWQASNQSVRFAASASVSVLRVGATYTAFRVTPGKTYTFVAEVATSAASGVTVEAGMSWRINDGNSSIGNEYGPRVAASSAAHQVVHATFTAPPGADYLTPTVVTRGNATGNASYARRFLLYEGDELIGYFDGNTPETTQYEYTWSDPDEPANSASTRRTLIDAPTPEALIWQAGDSAMDFLQALLKTTGLRLVCDEQRRWTLRSDEYRASGAQSWRYGVNITAADESLSRDDETWFDAAVYVYKWTDRDDIAQTRTDAYSLSPTPTKVLKREVDTAYPGPGRAEHMVKRAQGKGRTITVSGIPAWTEQTDQELAILLDGTPIQTGIAARVRFDFDTDEVTVSSRTTDTPAGAIDLLPGTINALAGTINNL